MTEQAAPVITQAAAPYAVICDQTDEGHFTGFVHEADMFLATLGEEVYEGRMTAEEARELWSPYRQFDEEIYDPIEWEDDPHQGFPYVMGDGDYLPATIQFQEDVRALGLPGVNDGPNMGRPMSCVVELLQIDDRETLEAVRQALAEKYTTAVLPVGDQGEWTLGLRETARTVEWARQADAPVGGSA